MAYLGGLSSLSLLAFILLYGQFLHVTDVSAMSACLNSTLVCANGGTCQLHTFGEVCLCSPDYSGPSCETRLCQNTCLNQGICVFSTSTGETCLCNMDYYGTTCENTSTYTSLGKTRYAALEKDGIFNVDILRTGDLNKESKIRFQTFEGSATEGADFIGRNRSVTFNPGDVTKTVSINIDNDAMSEPVEAFSIVVSRPIDAELRYPYDRASVYILDDDAPILQVFPLDPILRVSGSNENAVITLLRSGAIGRDIPFTVFIMNSATSASIVINSTMELILAPNVYTLPVVVPLQPIDPSLTFPRTDHFMLSYVIYHDAQVISGNVTVIVESYDNTVFLPGTLDQTYLYFGHLPYITNEDDRVIDIPIYRLGNLDILSDVEIYTSSGSAQSRRDFQPVQQVVFMSLSEDSTVVSIPILNDNETESADEIFYVTMNVRAGGILGRPSEQTAAVTIRADLRPQDPVTVSLMWEFEVVNEGQGTVTVTVLRQGRLKDMVSVVVKTEGLTAESSIDFIAVEIVIIFPAQSDVQTVQIGIIDDDVIEVEERFAVALGAVSQGTVIEPSRTEILILDNDGMGSGTVFESSTDSTTPQPSAPEYITYIIIAGAVVIVAIVIVIVMAICFFRRKGESNPGPSKSGDVPLTTKSSTMRSNSYLQRGSPMPVVRNAANSVDPKTGEYPREQLRFYEEIGRGAFATVFRAEGAGILKSGVVSTVAVKMLKENASESDKCDFMKELYLLKMLDPHPNVMTMLGCCTANEPAYLILEFMPRGNLQEYLQRVRTGKEVDHPGYLDGAQRVIQPEEVLKFSSEISRGMEYLASKECIHRDLACRNILLSQEYICKVSDFGLARDVAEGQEYEMKSKGRVPVRWLAPESLLHNTYTSKSDVWSFGVLMWELVTQGSHPYPGMSSQEVIRQVQRGYRLPKPEHCSQEIYDIMTDCWISDAEKRPTFQTLRSRLEGMLSDAQGYLFMEHLNEQDYIYMSPGCQSVEEEEDQVLKDVKVDS